MKRKYYYDRDKICLIVDTSNDNSKIAIECGLKKIEKLIKSCNSKKMVVIDTISKKEYKIKNLDEITYPTFDGTGDIVSALKRSLELESDLTFVFTNCKKLDVEKKDVPRCILWVLPDETISIDNFSNIGYIVKEIGENTLD